MSPGALSDFVKPDGWGDALSEARAARECGLSARALRVLAELADAGEIGLPVVRWECVRTRRGLEMIFDSRSIGALAEFVRRKRAALRAADVELAIAEGAATSGQMIERGGRLLFAPDDPERLHTDRAAELLGVTTREVRALCARGRLRAARGSRLSGTRHDLLVETGSLADLVAERNRAATGA